MCHRPGVSPVTQIIDQFCADSGIDVPRSDVFGEDATCHVHFFENEVAVLIHKPTGKEYWYEYQEDRTWLLMKVECVVLH